MSDKFNPYAAAFANRQGPGDARPTALQIVQDNDLLGNLSGKVALVTGGAGGIGVETVRALHATGADVYFTARNMEKAAKVRESILSTSEQKGRIEVIEMRNDSLDSVRDAAQVFLGKSQTLNILVNNAGIMAKPYGRTMDGFEEQFAINHLSHYLLIRLLLPTLIASSTPELQSRVISVSSSLHRSGKVRWDDCNFEQPDSYDPWLAYGQSKTAMNWTSNYIDRVYGPQGVHALSLHPGSIETGLQDHIDDEMKAYWDSIEDIRKMRLSHEQGAATTLWSAVGKVWEGKGGEYLVDCRTTETHEPPYDLLYNEAAAWVKEPESEDRLWDMSARLVGIE